MYLKVRFLDSLHFSTNNVWDYAQNILTYVKGMRKRFYDVENWFPSKSADVHEHHVKGLLHRCTKCVANGVPGVGKAENIWIMVKARDYWFRLLRNYAILEGNWLNYFTYNFTNTTATSHI
jgi:hypothetical protein